jgi:hypothetical protein
MIVFAVIFRSTRPPDWMDFWIVFFSWVLVSTSMQILFALNARRVLLKDFRLLANPLSLGSFSVWRWFGRKFGLLIHNARRTPATQTGRMV